MFGLRTREDKESCTLGLLWLLWRYSWAEKKGVHGRDAFGSNVFKNQAGYIT